MESASTLYRKKPVVIEAMQYPGLRELADTKRVIEWLNSNNVRYASVPKGLAINTLEGAMLASPGDWIIKDVHGEFYPCKPNIFEATYEEVEALNESVG